MKLARIVCVYVMVCFFSSIVGMRTQPMTQYIHQYSDDRNYSSNEKSNYTEYDAQTDFRLDKGSKKNNVQKQRGYYDSGYYNYLTTAPFQQRLQDAAALVADCHTIIEIGGGLNPISKYATNPQVIVIDPEVKPYVKKKNSTQNILHSAKYFQDWHEEYLLNNGTYAVVIMGLGLGKMPNNGWQKLYALMAKSKKVVIEISTDYRPAKRQLKNIIHNIKDKVITQTKEYNFSGPEYKHYFKNCSHVNPFRKMVLFEEVAQNKSNLLEKEHVLVV